MNETGQTPETVLSVNLNKIALLRNSRGRNYPSVVDFARKTIELGVKGITIHPRPDERHIRQQDARDLAILLTEYKDVELNVEGFPTESFIALVQETRPHQVTLVPDGESQLTSDHGWNLTDHLDELTQACDQLRLSAGRLAVFVDPGVDLTAVKGVCNRVELYTEAYAVAYASGDDAQIQSSLALYRRSVEQAQMLGLGVNAGHDLDLHNLARFLEIPQILEVSIGHALTVEALENSWSDVIGRYLSLCR